MAGVRGLESGQRDERPVAAVPGGDRPASTAPPAGRQGAGGAGSEEAEELALRPAEWPTPVQVRFRKMPRAGMLFDLDSGEVLWRRNARRRLPIASLTKMMTALLVVNEHEPLEKVRISRRARQTPGSAVGVLPAGKRVRLEALLGGLLMVSGNDAAVALAEHDSGSVRAFADKMNQRAAELGLACSRFNTPHGLRDAGNYSCAEDLAVLTRAAMAEERIAALTRRREVAYPFPIKGGRLFLTNNNPLLRSRARGVIGLKTGYTRRAGRCYVTVAERGGRRLGVVLLRSPDPVRQIKTLLRLGARA